MVIRSSPNERRVQPTNTTYAASERDPEVLALVSGFKRDHFETIRRTLMQDFLESSGKAQLQNAIEDRVDRYFEAYSSAASDSSDMRERHIIKSLYSKRAFQLARGDIERDFIRNRRRDEIVKLFDQLYEQKHAAVIDKALQNVSPTKSSRIMPPQKNNNPINAAQKTASAKIVDELMAMAKQKAAKPVALPKVVPSPTPSKPIVIPVAQTIIPQSKEADAAPADGISVAETAQKSDPVVEVVSEAATMEIDEVLLQDGSKEAKEEATIEVEKTEVKPVESLDVEPDHISELSELSDLSPLSEDDNKKPKQAAKPAPNRRKQPKRRSARR